MKTLQPWAQQILARSTITGNVLKLPEQLERADYVAIDKALKGLGGKWDRKAGGHVFPFDPTELVQSTADTGRYTDRKQDLQFFETPEDLARRMVDRAKVMNGTRVLEPSAGHGRIVTAALAAGGLVTAVEIDRTNIEALLRRTPQLLNTAVHCADFLTWCNDVGSVRFDAIVMNPPFSNSQDICHIAAAWTLLEKAGRLVSVVSASTLIGSNRLQVRFREWIEQIEATVEELPEGTFARSGTMVHTHLLSAVKSAGDPAFVS